MFILVALGAVVLFMSLYCGYLYQFVYRLRAWRAGASMPVFSPSIGFGIPDTRKILQALKEKRLLEVIREMMRKVGADTYVDQRSFHWAVSTIDPENVKTILATKFKDYSLGLREPQLGKAFGSGIFTLSGEGWKHSRQMLRPQFSRDQVSQLDSVTSHVNKLIEVIELEQNRHQYFDVQPLFHELTIDTATEFLFGESLNCLDEIAGGQAVAVTFNGRTVDAHEFVESYMHMLSTSVNRLVMGPFYMLADSLEFRRHINRARVVVDYYVQMALDKAKNVDEKQPDSYVFSWELAKVTKDPVVIRDQIFNILIAGRDTTAVTMSFITFYLSHHPDVLAKLRETVLSEFGTVEDKVPITFEMLRGCKYLNAVINEVLRLAPVVPLNFRTAIRDTMLPRGGGPKGDEPLFVPKGMPVSYHVFTLHRDPKVWGPDANEFNPDRWLHKQDIPSWAYIPFNGGPRICLGQQFALTELALTWVRLLQQYSKIIPAPDMPKEPAFDYFLTIRYAGDLKVRFEH